MLFDFADIAPRNHYKLLVSTVTPRPSIPPLSRGPRSALLGFPRHLAAIFRPSDSCGPEPLRYATI